MKIAVMGTGGVGGYLGGRLAQADLDVTFIARGTHLQAIQQGGLHVLSPRGDFIIRPAQVTDNPGEVGPVDVILFCVKAYDAASAAKFILPMLGPNTAIIPVLNGIDHIALLQAVAGDCVLGGTAYVGSNIAAPGSIRHWGGESLIFGELAGGQSERCAAIQQVMTVSGCQIEAVPDILDQMWRKLVILCGMGVCSVVRGDTAVVRSTPESFALVRQAVLEAGAVARARGMPLSETTLEEMIAGYPPFPLKPSMLVDVERGNRLEVEALNGAVSRMGHELDVPTPVNDFIYACLKPYVNGALQASQSH